MDTNTIAFTRGVPPVESFPIEALIASAEHVILENGAQILQYGSGAGYHPMRDYIAEKHDVKTDRVLVGQGSLQLLDHLCRVLVLEDDLVFIEQPTYDRVITLFNRAGLTIEGMDIKNDQIDLAPLVLSLENGRIPKFVYVIPDFQNPGGSTMSLEDRKTLISLADRYGFMIIEDGPYRHLRYRGTQLPSLFELSPEAVVHMSSFSKMISPGLRTGYMILPENIAPDVIKFAADTYISPSMFDQAIVHEFLNMESLDTHISRLKGIFQPRLNVILKALDQHLAEFGDWTRPEGGYYVGFFLKDNMSSLDLSSASKFGLALSDGRGFFIQGGERFLRLPFCALTEDEIEEGIIRLRKMITQ